jgi:hypothetical protein
MNEKDLDNLFVEIKRGFSVLKFQESLFYVKHPGIKEIELLNKDRANLLLKAKKKGIPTEEELFQTLNETEQWTSEDEKKLSNNLLEVKNLEQTMMNLMKDSEKAPLQSRLDEIKNETQELQSIRSSLIRISAEKYANKKSNENFLQKSLYKDSECMQHHWTEDEFNEIDIITIQNLYDSYNKLMEKFSDKNIQQISISGIFKSLLNLYDKNISNFFKKHPLDLSYYQINLLNYGKMFTTIFENKEIPEDISNDAEKIIKYLEESKIKKKKAQRVLDKSNSSDGFSYVGATRKDLDSMGVKKQGGKDIHSLAADKGGELSMEDFMKIHKK